MEEELFIEMIPAENKCWKNSKGHKFINTNGKQGLSIYIENTEEAKAEFKKEYIEVDIKEKMEVQDVNI